MGLLQQPVERKLSAVLGAEVTFEKLHFSVLGGSVEAQGVIVAGHDPAVPLLTIRRVRAEISLGAALKKEFVVRSLTIEKPIVTLTRGADGRLNLPPRFQPTDTPASASATTGRASDTPSAAPSNDEQEGTWKFEAQKVLVVDGEVHYRDASGYHASIEQLLAEVKDANGGLELTLIADSAGRRDQAADLGQVRANARADNLPNLSQWRNASVHGSLEVADRLRLRAHVPAVNPLDAKLEFNGSVSLADLMKLLPDGIAALDAFRAGALRGQTEFSGRATYRQPEGLRVPDLTFRAVDVILSRGAGGAARP
jgi:uncharacterized protein involved in outer membrane biogenesis